MSLKKVFKNTIEKWTLDFLYSFIIIFYSFLQLSGKAELAKIAHVGLAHAGFVVGQGNAVFKGITRRLKQKKFTLKSKSIEIEVHSTLKNKLLINKIHTQLWHT